MTWANAQTNAPSLELLRGLVESREGPQPVFHVRLLKTAFFSRFVQALAEAFTTKCDLQSKDPVYFSPPSLEETSL